MTAAGTGPGEASSHRGRAMSADPAGATIRRSCGDRLGEVGDVLAQSHADYPAFVYTFPDPAQRRKALRRLFTAVGRDAARFDSLFVAEASDGGLHGAAIWLPPGAFPWSPGRQARAAIDFFCVLAAAPRSFPTFMQTGKNAEKLHPRTRPWYLEALGVVPAAQAKGLGARLISPILELADQEEVDCYLETSDRSNVPFYERRGFRLEEAALPLVPGGPTHCSMRRAARLQWE